jgi:membrane protein implicated in regulation of membrane protease activity
MEDILFKIWLGLGIILVIAEFLLPGLVAIFVGMGALAVSLAMQQGWISTLPEQLILFFISSLFFLFTLRFLILRFVPTETRKANIDLDDEVMGQIVEVVESIPVQGVGRVKHSDSTWKARSNSQQEISVGEKCKIIGRENITWLVEKI